jgi:hypothetical protein
MTIEPLKFSQIIEIKKIQQTVLIGNYKNGIKYAYNYANRKGFLHNSHHPLTLGPHDFRQNPQ